jgi:predicted transcriptional regulator of viral defense system
MIIMHTESNKCRRFYHMKKKDPISIFRKHKGILRTAEAIKLGIHPVNLYKLRDEGILESLGRGVFRLVSIPDFSEPDIVLAAKRIPRGVICLISALSYYNLTTQIPHFIYIALPRTSRLPKLNYPPLRCFWYSKKTYEAGIETISINKFPVKIYSIEKTLADCIKFRQKIGMNVVLEALKEYWRLGKTNLDKLYDYAKICRVEKILQPIIETIVSQ